MKIAIMGTGSIAEKMAVTIEGMDGVTVCAVCSRTIERAKAFAARHGIEKAYGTYEEMVEDEGIDLVYVATPHSRHYEDAMLCLTHGLPVLCEKAFTANAKQAKSLIAYAEEHQIFLAEAMWTRYMPMRKILDEVVQSGVIGEISSLTANIGYELTANERLQKPELAGGALLDLGIYPLTFALTVFGTEIEQMTGVCSKNAYGVDKWNSITLTYADGKMAVLHSNAAANTDRKGIIYGTKGRIEVENINNYEVIRVILDDGSVTTYEAPAQITGYEYEVMAACEALKQQQTEVSAISHQETIHAMELMDALRQSWQIVYPFE